MRPGALDGVALVVNGRREALADILRDLSVHFYVVPQGATLTQEESVTVDETVVPGQSRSATAPAPKKKAKKAAAAPASN